MTIEISQLREALHSGPDAEGCPSADRFWQAARGLAPPEEAQALLNHVAGCGACALAWQLAHELAAEAGELPRFDANVVPISRKQWRWAAAAIAGLAVAAAVPLVLRRPTTEAEFRGDAVAPLRLLSVEPLLRSRCLIRWAGAGAGARYDATVATRDLRVLLLARGLEAPELLVPEAALAGIPAGGEIALIVTASLADGSHLSSGALFARLE